MTDATEQLYKEIILDHYRRPRNRGTLPPPARHSKGFNPLCGDEVTVYVEVDPNGVVADVRIDGRGCAISQASASMMTEALRGSTLAEVEERTARFLSMLGVTDDAAFDGGADLGTQLGDVEALQSVKQFPARIKCATLSWNTLAAALAAEESFTET